MRKGFQVGLMVLFLLSGTQAGAHSLWLNMEGHCCHKGQPVNLGLGWGHKFPKDGEIREGIFPGRVRQRQSLKRALGEQAAIT